MSYGWRDFDQSVVRAIAAGDRKHLSKQAGGGMTCPLVGHGGEWLRWQGDNYAKGTMPHGSPEVVFRVRPTYILSDPLANFIVGKDLAWAVMEGDWGKAETRRLGYENSEDALSFNVFRSLQESGSLARVAEAVIGKPVDDEPDLFMWGRIVNRDGTTERWCDLRAIRDRVEPTHRQQTEPDVCLHVRGWGWIFIEAKFNVGIKTAASAEKLQTWHRVYPQHARSLFDLERVVAARPKEFPEQLLRNMVFADLVRGDENAHVVALGREKDKTPIAAWVGACLASDCPVGMSSLSWEEIYRVLRVASDELAGLRAYLEDKSYSLRRAFNLNI